MVVDGRAIAGEILAEVRSDVEELGRSPLVRAIVVAPNVATRSYLKIKTKRAEDAGMHLEVVELSEDATTEDCVAAVQAAGADAIIVQLPLPLHIDTKVVLEQIPQSLDADVLSQVSRHAFEMAQDGVLLPPVVAACKEILERTQTSVSGKRAVVIGNGWLVGAPVQTWLTQQGAHVSCLSLPSTDFSVLKDADMVIGGAGSPHLVRKEMLKFGVALIDAGTSESDGALVGDIHPECEEIASVFTPVPGGVGPLAVACLFQNVLKLSKYKL